MKKVYIMSPKSSTEKSFPFIFGETKQDFITKICFCIFHKRERERDKKIRLETIVRPQSLSSYNHNENEFKHLLQTIESRLVKYLLENGYETALCNKRQVKDYTKWFK